jgi:hypothetical protein
MGPFECSIPSRQASKDDSHANYVPEYMTDQVDDPYAKYVQPEYPRRDMGSLAINFAKLAFVLRVLILVVGIGLRVAPIRYG